MKTKSKLNSLSANISKQNINSNIKRPGKSSANRNAVNSIFNNSTDLQMERSSYINKINTQYSTLKELSSLYESLINELKDLKYEAADLLNKAVISQSTYNYTTNEKCKYIKENSLKVIIEMITSLSQQNLLLVERKKKLLYRKMFLQERINDLKEKKEKINMASQNVGEESMDQITTANINSLNSIKDLFTQLNVLQKDSNFIIIPKNAENLRNIFTDLLVQYYKPKLTNIHYK